MRYKVLIERENFIISDYCFFGRCGILIDGEEIDISDTFAPILMEETVEALQIETS